MTIDNERHGKWAEYDDAAEWCAIRGIKGEHGDPLPRHISADVYDEITADPEAFEQRVRDCAYANAMNALQLDEEPTP